jgi:hypothetical protein
MTSELLVMNLQPFRGTTVLAPPTVPLEHLPAKLLVALDV